MHQKPLLLRSIEKDRMVVGLREDGIIHVYYKDYTVIDLELQEEMIKAVAELCGGEKRLFIYEAGHQCSINKQARDNAIPMEDKVPAIASVVYVQNVVYKMLANFYYKFNRPKQPFYVVSKFEEGIAWLKGMGKTSDEEIG